MFVPDLPKHHTFSPSIPQTPQRINMDDSVRQYLCGTCDLAVTWEEKGVICETCDQWYHSSCQNIGSQTYDKLSDSELDIRNASVIIGGDFNFPGWDWTCNALKPGSAHPNLHIRFSEILANNSDTIGTRANQESKHLRSIAYKSA